MIADNLEELTWKDVGRFLKFGDKIKLENKKRQEAIFLYITTQGEDIILFDPIENDLDCYVWRYVLKFGEKI